MPTVAYDPQADADTDLFALLGVEWDAPHDDVRRAWRVASRDAHPDAGGTHDAFIALQHAWEVLGDATLRTRYIRAYEARHGPQRPRSSARQGAGTRGRRGDGDRDSRDRATGRPRPGGHARSRWWWPPRAQCSATTAAGRRCANPATHGTDRCWRHPSGADDQPAPDGRARDRTAAAGTGSATGPGPAPTTQPWRCPSPVDFHGSRLRCLYSRLIGQEHCWDHAAAPARADALAQARPGCCIALIRQCRPCRNRAYAPGIPLCHTHLTVGVFEDQNRPRPDRRGSSPATDPGDATRPGSPDPPPPGRRSAPASSDRPTPDGGDRDARTDRARPRPPGSPRARGDEGGTGGGDDNVRADPTTAHTRPATHPPSPSGGGAEPDEATSGPPGHEHATDPNRRQSNDGRPGGGAGSSHSATSRPDGPQPVHEAHTVAPTSPPSAGAGNAAPRPTAGHPRTSGRRPPPTSPRRGAGPARRGPHPARAGSGAPPRPRSWPRLSGVLLAVAAILGMVALGVVAAGVGPWSSRPRTIAFADDIKSATAKCASRVPIGPGDAALGLSLSCTMVDAAPANRDRPYVQVRLEGCDDWRRLDHDDGSAPVTVDVALRPCGAAPGGVQWQVCQTRGGLLPDDCTDGTTGLP